MDLTNSILKDIRDALDLDPDGVEFNTDIMMYINSSIVKLIQNGVGQLIVVNDASSTWGDLVDTSQVEGNRSFQLVPLFIKLNTKLLFDPPPPSTVERYTDGIRELLWRLKIAYELGGV